MEYRHCKYTSNKIKLEHSPEVNFNTCFYEKYNNVMAKKDTEANQHLGQRKLLLSEIQLLTKYYTEQDTDPVVIYIGAAPGIHLPFLSKLFPNVKFILYDGAKFCNDILENPKTYKIKNIFFDSDECKKLKKRY